MANPTKYTQAYDFSDFSAHQPNAQQPGDRIDVELAGVEQSIDEIVDAIADVRRSDGALKNGIVTGDSLAPGLLTLIPTAAQVLASLLTVDGSASGLDADLLDGQHAAAFASASDLVLKANLASPTFTGTPAAPTAVPGTNTTQLATTAFVVAAVVALGIGAYTLSGYTAVSAKAASTDSFVIAKRTSDGVYGFGHPLDYGTSYPVFRMDTTYSQPKLQVRSIVIADPGDTPEIAFLIVNGTPGSPTSRTAPYPGAYLYGWPRDSAGNFLPTGTYAGSNPYNGRNVQIAFALIETPTPTARGGALVVSPTMPGETATTDRAWFRGIGLVIAGRGSREDSGVSYPWDPSLYSIEQNGAPGAHNYYNTDAIGNLTLIMSDAVNAPGIALRKYNSITNGVDVSFDYSNNAMQWQRVDSGTKSTAGQLRWTNGEWSFGHNSGRPSVKINQQQDATSTASWISISGNTTPTLGAGSASTNVALSLLGQGNLGVIIAGTGTNDDAAAGKVGEIIESEVTAGSAISVTTATNTDITSISLTAGDWDVWGNISFLPAATTVVTEIRAWISTASATLPTNPNKGALSIIQTTFATAQTQTISAGKRRISLSATTTVYLTCREAHTTSTLTAYGYIGARRVR